MRISPRVACNAVRQICEDRLGKGVMTARPWNRFEPENSLWWLVPDTGWPAYRHAKFYFAQSENDSDLLEVGLHVEKGLGAGVKDAYPGRGASLIMDRDWCWHRLISSEGEALIADAFEAAVLPIHFRVEGTYVSDPRSYDPQATVANRSTIEFIKDGDGHGAVYRRDGEPYELVLPLRDASDANKGFASLVDGLRAVDTNEWAWYDCFLFARWPTDADSAEAFAHLVWDRQLVNWVDWVSPTH